MTPIRRQVWCGQAKSPAITGVTHGTSIARERCVQPSTIAYRPRRVEETLLYRTVARYWPKFVEQVGEHGSLPRFVQREFEAYLKCGVLEYGFARCECRSCGHEHLVPFSCKRRGFCPSCIGRRMNDVSLHLVDNVLSAAPLRQWVCTVAPHTNARC